MEKMNININYEVICQSAFFKNISKADLPSLLGCLSAKVRLYQKGSYIFFAGDKSHFLGIVQAGVAAVIKENEDGTRNIISKLGIAEMFGEAYMLKGEKSTPVSVIALEECEVLLLDYNKITTVCPATCAFHIQVIKNMTELLVEKVVMLSNKLNIVSKKTIREKLMAFLKMQRDYTKSDKFVINYSREQLADFLYIDRSAMSRELGKMRNDGLIRFNKNEFEIL